MSDYVVTVPKGMWADWIEEGDLPGDQWSGYESHFWVSRLPVSMTLPGRLYIVAHGRLRGYAPIVGTERSCCLNPDRSCFLRLGGAVAVTIDEPIPGFRGWRQRWWDVSEERPFPGWRTA